MDGKRDRDPCDKANQHRDALLQRRRQRGGSLSAASRPSSRLGNYRYEHIFIDNASQDKTQAILRRLAAEDKNVKVILNTRNFGHIRSPYYAHVAGPGRCGHRRRCRPAGSAGDDSRFPPRSGRAGTRSSWRKKPRARNRSLFFFIRRTYYYIARKLADIDLLDNVTGFGLYDRAVVDILRQYR